MTSRNKSRNGLRWGALGLAAALLALSPVSAAPAKPSPGEGFVDSSVFLELAGDDAVLVEVSIPGPLIKALTKIDPELHQLAGGLDSIQAVVVSLSGPGVDDDRDEDSGPIPELLSKARRVVVEQEKRLLARGWERLARVRDPESEVRILVLNDEEIIRGLVVMVIDKDEGQVVFVNIAGELDLGALEAIGEQFDIPGLEELSP